MKIAFIICLFLVLTSANSFAISLQEAIQTSFKKNPITQANDLRLEAAKDRARGAKLDMLPTGDLSYSHSRNSYNSVSNGVHHSGVNQNRGWNVGASVNIFRGGADLNRARAAQKDVEALESQNNSTNALIPDTKGSLAGEVFSVYVALAYNQDQLSFLKERKAFLEILLKVSKTEDQKNEVRTAIAGNDNNLIRVLGNYKRNILTYEYLVKMPFPNRVDSFEEISETLLVPASPSEAITIARAKSPDIRVAIASLEASQYRKKARVGEAFSPRVDLSFNRGQNFFRGEDSISQNTGSSVHLTVSVPFGASKFAYAEADSKEVEARQKDLDKVYDRLAHTLADAYYPQMQSYADLAERYRAALLKTNADIHEILIKAENGENVDIRYALSLGGSQESQFYNLTDNLNYLVEMKFAIQREIGTLFEKIKEETLHLD